jgi:hypothetical protein
MRDIRPFLGRYEIARPRADKGYRRVKSALAGLLRADILGVRFNRHHWRAWNIRQSFAKRKKSSNIKA